MGGWKERIMKGLKKRCLQKMAPPRKVFVNMDPPSEMLFNNKPSQSFPENAIRTTKYTAFNFIFKNLYEQFRRIANLFFLCLVILQFFPEYQTINPFVAALPLTAVIILTAAKDGMEDWKRHKSDIGMNAQPTQVLGGQWKNTNAPFLNKNARLERVSPDARRKVGKHAGTVSPVEDDNHDLQHGKDSSGNDNVWKETSWGNVKVGDVVLLRNNEPIPADLVILSTSEPECLCYIETKNLDGETNLKIRKGLSETSFLTPTSMQEFHHLQFCIESEPPNSNLFSFKSTAVFPRSTLTFVEGKTAMKSLGQSWGSETNTIVIEEVGVPKVPLNVNGFLLRGCVLRNTEWVVGLVIFTGAETKICLNAGETPLKQSKIDVGMNNQVMANLIILGMLSIIMCFTSPSSSISWAWEGFVAFWASLITFQNIVPISLYITLEIVKTFQAFFISMDIEMYYERIDQPCLPRSWNLADDLGQIDYIFSDKTGTLTQNIMQFRKCSINGVIYGDPPPSIYNFRTSIRSSTTSLTAIALRHSESPSRPSTAPRVSKVSPKSRHRIRPRKKKISPLPPNPNPHRNPTSLPTSQNLSSQTPVSTRNSPTSSAASTAPSVTSSPLLQSAIQSSPDEAALVQAAADLGIAFVSREESSIIVDVLGEREQCTLLNIIEFNSTRKRMSVIVRRPAGEIVLYCKGADSVIYERLMTGQDAIKDVTANHLEIFATEGLRTLCIAYTILPESTYALWSQKYHEASVSLSDRDAKMDLVAEEIEQNFLLIGATAIEDKLQDGVPECIQQLSRAGIKLWVLTGDKMETAINIGLSCNLLTKDMNLILVKGENGKEVGGDVIRQQIDGALERFWGGKGDKGLNEPIEEGETYGLVIDGSALIYALEPASIDGFLDLATRCGAVICCRVSPLQKAQVVEMVKSRRHALCLAIGDGANDVSMIQAANVGVGIAGEEGLQAVMASDYAIGQFRYLQWASLTKTSPTPSPSPSHGLSCRPRLFPFTLFRFTAFVLEAAYQAAICFYFTFYGFSETPFDHSGRLLEKPELSVMLSIMAVLNANFLVAVNMNSWNVVSITTIGVTQVLPFLYTAIYSALPISLVEGFVGPLYSAPMFWLNLILTSFLCQFPRTVFLFGRRTVFPTDIHILQESQAWHADSTTSLSEQRISNAEITCHEVKWARSERHSIASKFVEAGRPSISRQSVGGPSAYRQSMAGPGVNRQKKEIPVHQVESDHILTPPAPAYVEHPKPRTAHSVPDIPAIALSSADVERQHSSGSMYSMASVVRTPVHIAFSDDVITKPRESVNILTSPGARDIIMGRHSICAPMDANEEAETEARRVTHSTPLFVRTNTAPQ
ncbi:hypothetical protein BC829DRAFT_493000 [Chytridium lagenaria]|nr:hypothetical protein BC829DRAFT_493000 [Chytridium lagenaria]